ncbi:choice-of-anchor M domain-containing protein [Actinoplanes rectilineatus]|uniref:choice-of-anchor M domain-containing protein n=1 Tax=Actinoplanes rectilineatus TaxID=113571 RepID=UPI0005F2B84E|nr:choice-of-anchor M domain-containing protein [Actinoplanes rectilineatus]
MRNSLRLLAGSGFLAASLAGVAGPAQAHPAVPPTVLSSGHVDAVDVEYEDGQLELAVHDEESDAEFAPSEVVLLVKKAAQTAVPDDANYAFLGDPGDSVWILPEIQNPDLLWAGLSTEELEAGVFAGDQVSIDVQNVRGPGDVAVFTSDAVGTPNVLVDSGDGLPDTVALGAGSHEHVNWAFERPGTYKLTVSASATLAGSGETVTSEPATYTFKVQK